MTTATTINYSEIRNAPSSDTQRAIEATLAKIDAAMAQARAVCLTGLDAETYAEVYAAMVALNDAQVAILRAAIAAK